MPSITAHQGAIQHSHTAAAAVFENAFFPGREPRSAAYREGMLQALQRRLDGTPFPPLKYRLGTAERDAYFAGMDEGNTLANTVTSA